MCELLDKYEKRGIERGIERGMETGLAKGERRMALLIQRLVGMNRTEDLMRATSDAEYRSRLFQELGIV